MTKPTLYLMLGYPGAGKTTTAKALQKLTGAIHISSDKFRIDMFNSPLFSQDEHDKLYTTLDFQTEQLLSEGKSVIYDANLNRHQHRQDKYDICKRTNAQARLVWVQTPKEIAKKRAIDSSRSHLVPRTETASQMFDRIANIIEEPGADEPYVVIDGTKVTPKHIAKTLGL